MHSGKICVRLRYGIVGQGGVCLDMVTFLMVVQFLICIGLIVTVVLQESKGEGLGSIGGGGKMFFSKASRKEIVLEKSTQYLAVAFMVMAVILSLI